MVHLYFSSFSLEIQESAHSFPAQRVVIEPTRGTATVLSLRAVYPCSSHERNCKSDRKFLSIMLRGRNRAPLLLRSLDIENYEGCLEINERIYISRNWEVLVETILFFSKANLLQVNARTEGYWQVSLRKFLVIEFLFLAAYAAKSHSTTTQYRQLHRLLGGGTTKFHVVWRQQWVQNISQLTKGTSHKSVFGDVPRNRLQSLKITLLKSDQYYSHFTTYYLISWLLGWSLNWELTQDRL